MEMIKNEVTVRFILVNTFFLLTGSSPAFIDLEGFKTAEIKFNGLETTIGLGFCESATIMKIFYIDNQYDKNDNRRFKPMLTIGYKNLEDAIVWDVRFVNEPILIPAVGNFELVAANMQAMFWIMKIIAREECRF
jgi:hypothetical protein